MAHSLKKSHKPKGFLSAAFDSETGDRLPCEQPVSTGFMKFVLGSSAIKKYIAIKEISGIQGQKKIRSLTV